MAILAPVLALGCGSEKNPPASGAAGNDAVGSGGKDDGDVGSGGGGRVSASSGSGGRAGDEHGGTSSGGVNSAAGNGGSMVSNNPLCPTTGPVVAASTPLPDGVEVASSETDAKLLVVSDEFAYWANDSIIRRISVADNTEEIIVDRSATDYKIKGIAIDDDNVYFTETGLGAPVDGPLAVAKAPLDGSAAPVSIANEGPEGSSSMAGLTVADGYVYYLNARTSEISRVSVDGGTPTLMLRGANPSTMVVAGGYLWFMHPITNAIDNVNLLRVAIDAVAPPEDTPPEAVNVPPGAEAVAPVFNYRATGVSADAEYIYYDDENKVMRVAIDGGTPEVLAEAPDHPGFVNPETTYVSYVVPANNGVFWDTDGSACDSVMKSSFDGATTAPFVNAVRAPSVLRVNATHLYFNAWGQILRVPL